MACALDADGIECWGSCQGDNNEGCKIPQLKNPRKLSVGEDDDACALDDEGLKCWGSPQFTEKKMPFDPTKVVDFAVGLHHACAKTMDNKISCWGDLPHAYIRSPE